MERDILKIDEELCNGCGLCVPNCHEGALQVIDGKVRLLSELMCDGLGACIGYCPEGAITIERREAAPYDEALVLEQMVVKGKNTVVAHLKHLKDHGETGFLQDGARWLKENRDILKFNPDEVLDEVHNYEKPYNDTHFGVKTGHHHHGGGCPGSKAVVIEKEAMGTSPAQEDYSELRQWPVQMHLINPDASYFKVSDLLLAADCVAYSAGAFHSRYLRGKTLAIACPKLDQNTDVYVKKLTALIDSARVNTITIMIMEVPCCGGLLQIAKAALAQASRRVPLKMTRISISGELLTEEWV